MALLVGIDAEARSDLRTLRRAYAALDRLRVTEAERAALEERARLAREIHDGLAQHLWFAKLKHDRLTPLVPEEARPLSSEVGQALDAAIVEARQALVTMRSGAGPAMPLADLIAQAVEDFGQRFGLRVEFVADPLPTAIPARQQAELLRVVQEALTNVRKHADATMVRVRAGLDGDALLVTVTDNGRGFQLDAPRNEGLGLLGMEERARLMGGNLGISSEPSDGTSVSVRLPLEDRLPPVAPVLP
jgi:signal transduction histidine kinase